MTDAYKRRAFARGKYRTGLLHIGRLSVKSRFHG